MVFAIHWHEAAMDLHVFPIPIPLGLPSAPALSTCLMHPTWAGDLFHPWEYTCFDAVLSKHPTFAFSLRVQKSVLYICHFVFLMSKFPPTFRIMGHMGWQELWALHPFYKFQISCCPASVWTPLVVGNWGILKQALCSSHNWYFGYFFKNGIID